MFTPEHENRLTCLAKQAQERVEKAYGGETPRLNVNPAFRHVPPIVPSD
jgi:hypothetical protein